MHKALSNLHTNFEERMVASDQQNDVHTEVIYSHKPQDSVETMVIPQNGMVVVTENEFTDVELPVLDPPATAVFTFSDTEKTQIVSALSQETAITTVVSTGGLDDKAKGKVMEEENTTIISPVKPVEIEPETSVLIRDKSHSHPATVDATVSIMQETIPANLLVENTSEVRNAYDSALGNDDASSPIVHIESVEFIPPIVSEEQVTTIVKRRPISDDDARFAPGAGGSEISMVDIEAIRSEAKYGAPVDAKSFYLKNAARSDYEEQEISLYEFHESDDNVSERNSVSSYFPKITPSPVEKAVNAESVPRVNNLENATWTEQDERLRYSLPVDSFDPAVKVKRGTLDFGLLILRLLIAAILLFKGLEWFFGLSHGVQIPAFVQHITEPKLGFKPQYADALIWISSALCVITALAIIIGVFTPVVAALALIVECLIAGIHMVNYGRVGILLDPELNLASSQWVLVPVLLLIILIFTGPGVYSVDFSRKWAKRPYIGSIIAVMIALIAVIVVWIVANGHNPLTLMHKK